jgi:hypothetical protein
LPDGIDVSNELIILRDRPCELDLQVPLWLAEAYATVLAEAIEQLDTLLQRSPQYSRSIVQSGCTKGALSKINSSESRPISSPSD